MVGAHNEAVGRTLSGGGQRALRDTEVGGDWGDRKGTALGVAHAPVPNSRKGAQLHRREERPEHRQQRGVDAGPLRAFIAMRSVRVVTFFPASALALLLAAAAGRAVGVEADLHLAHNSITCLHVAER